MTTKHEYYYYEYVKRKKCSQIKEQEPEEEALST